MCANVFVRYKKKDCIKLKKNYKIVLIDLKAICFAFDHVCVLAVQSISAKKI